MTVKDSPEILDKELLQLREEIERKTGKTPEQLYEEREKRVRDAIELKVPDRVPIMAQADPSKYTGIPYSAAYYDPIGYKKAMRQITLDLEPDMCNAGLPTSGVALEALGVKNRLWPGGPLPPDYQYQFVEGEWMKADEYDLFFNDTTDFILRYFLPRVYGALEPLIKLPPLGQMFGHLEGITTLFAEPEFEQLAKNLAKAGREMKKFRELTGDAYEELALLGFPGFSNAGLVGGAPFDTVSSFLRGMHGSMSDMYRQPDNLLKLCDLILERRIAQTAPADPTKRGNPKRVGMPLWRGDRSFMSDEHFRKFYWPGLKKQMAALIDLGYIPVPFFEDEFGERLECLLELPKGKVIASVEHMDVVKAKEILAGHHCVMGRGPLTHQKASLQVIEEYSKNLIDTCGKGGCFILSIRLPDHAGKEESQAMLDRIKEYARY